MIFCSSRNNTFNTGDLPLNMEKMLHKLKHMVGMCDCDGMKGKDEMVNEGKQHDKEHEEEE